MKAFIIDRYGSGARMRASEMPDPVMREDEVLVQIHAAGVNVLDSKIRSGEFKRLLPYRLPLVLGNDVASTLARRSVQPNESSNQSWIGSSRSNRPMKPWPTSKQDGQEVRSSSK